MRIDRLTTQMNGLCGLKVVSPSIKLSGFAFASTRRSLWYGLSTSFQRQKAVLVHLKRRRAFAYDLTGTAYMPLLTC
jgi:hypothetical protein